MEENKSLVVSKNIPKSDKYIPSQYLQAIYDKCDNIRDKAYIMFHAETGVRVSDIVGQKKKSKNERDLGIEENRIEWQHCRVWCYDHKKDKWRWVYFPEKVKAVLKQWLLYRQQADIKGRQLFPFSEKTCNRIIKYWAKEVNFTYAGLIGSHWLRHTYIRLSRAVGRDIKAVQQNTGDTIKTLLEWYSDLSHEAMRGEIEGKPIT